MNDDMPDCKESANGVDGEENPLMILISELTVVSIVDRSEAVDAIVGCKDCEIAPIACEIDDSVADKLLEALETSRNSVKNELEKEVKINEREDMGLNCDVASCEESVWRNCKTKLSGDDKAVN